MAAERAARPPAAVTRRPHAVLFDVGDTILEERRFDLAAGIAAVVPDGDSAAELASAFRLELAERHHENRELLLARWLRERVSALTAMSADEIEDLIWTAVVTLTPRPGVAAVLRRLAADGVPAAAISNAAFSGRVLRSELARHDLAGPLRFVLSSADLSVRKPDPSIFEAALARLGVGAAESWFVGDTLEEDMAGALAVGLRPIWFAHGAPPELSSHSVTVVRDWGEFLDLYASTSP